MTSRKADRRAAPLAAGLAASILCAILVLTPSVLPAQDFSMIGDVDASFSDAVVTDDETVADFVGLDPRQQIVYGTVNLHVSPTLSYDSGSFAADAALAWTPGTDGDVLAAFVREAYVSIAPTPEVAIDVGKHRLSWGSGYAFFPGDSFNPPPDPLGHSAGMDGLVLSLVPGASISLAGAVRLDTAFPELAGLSGFGSQASADAPFLAPYVPAPGGNPWSALRYALYADALLGSLDAHAAAVYQWDRTLRPSVGFSVDVLGMIVNAEGAIELGSAKLYPASGGSYDSPAFGTAFPIGSVGVQASSYTDALTLAATLEYEYDGTGYDRDQADTFFADSEAYYATLLALGPPPAGSPSPEATIAGAATSPGAVPSQLGIGGDYVPAPGRHRMALSASLEIRSAVRLTLEGIANLQDGSFAAVPEIRIIALPGVDVYARGAIAWGPNAQTEFGATPTPFVVTCGATTHF